jgi:uncharacterized DUF497 family protein
MQYEWDKMKNEINQQKHELSFEDRVSARKKETKNVKKRKLE